MYINHNGVNRITTTSSGVSVTGSLTASANVTAYSDARKKKDIRDLKSPRYYLDALSARRFKWKEDGREDIGFIAQEVEAAGLSYFITDEPVVEYETGREIDTVKTLDYGRMSSVLWQMVKEQQTEIDELKSLVKQLIAN